MALDIFVTYAPMDRLAATSLLRVMATRGLRSWQAPVDPSVDVASPDRISKILDSRALIVIVSKATNQLNRITHEITSASSSGLPIFFLALAGAPVPSAWVEWVNASNVMEANRPPTDAQLDAISEMMLETVGSEEVVLEDFEADAATTAPNDSPIGLEPTAAFSADTSEPAIGLENDVDIFEGEIGNEEIGLEPTAQWEPMSASDAVPDFEKTAQWSPEPPGRETPEEPNLEQTAQWTPPVPRGRSESIEPAPNPATQVAKSPFANKGPIPAAKPPSPKPPPSRSKTKDEIFEPTAQWDAAPNGQLAEVKEDPFDPTAVWTPMPDAKPGSFEKTASVAAHDNAPEFNLEDEIEMGSGIHDNALKFEDSSAVGVTSSTSDINLDDLGPLPTDSSQPPAIPESASGATGIAASIPEWDPTTDTSPGLVDPDEQYAAVELEPEPGTEPDAGQEGGLDLNLDDELSIDTSELAPSSAQSVASAPTQVIQAPAPRSVKNGAAAPAADEPATGKFKPQTDDASHPTDLVFEEDTVWSKLNRNRVVIGSIAGAVLLFIVIGIVVVPILFSSGPPPMKPHPTTPTPVAVAPKPILRTPTPSDPPAIVGPTVTPTLVQTPSTPEDPTASQTPTIPRYVTTIEDPDATPVAPADPAIDKTAAKIFATDDDPHPKTDPKHATGPYHSNPNNLKPTIASLPEPVTPADPGANMGSHALIKHIDDTSLPGYTGPIIKPFKSTNSSGSNTSSAANTYLNRLKADPINNAFQRPASEFSRIVSDQIAADATNLDELTEVANDEIANIKRQLDKTASIIAQRDHQIDLQIDELTQQIKDNPGDLTPWISRAGLKREKGDLQGAKADIDQVLRVNPDEPDGLREKAQIQDAMSDPNAIDSINGALSHTKSGEGLALRARILLRNGPNDAANRDINSALAQNPALVDALISRGDERMRRGDVDGAMADYNATLAVDSHNIDAIMGRARVNLRYREPLKALADLDQVVQNTNAYAEAFARRGEAYAMLYDYDRAMANADVSIKIDPRCWQGHMARAIILSCLGHDAMAARYAYWAIGLSPKSSQPYAVRGRIFLNMGDWDQASDDFTDSLRQDPNNLDAILSQAQLYRRQGLNDQSSQLCDRALKAYPLCTEAYVIRAAILRETHDQTGSIDQCQAALKIKPNDPGALLGIALADLGSGDLPNADAYAIRSIQSAPNLAHGYVLRAIISIERGAPERAKAFADEALKRCPGLAISYYGMGITQLARGNDKSAFENCAKALQLNPRFLGAMILKSRILINRKQTPEAIQSASDALVYNPGLVIGYVVRGWAYDAAGDKTHAREDYRRARTLDPQLDINSAKIYTFESF